MEKDFVAASKRVGEDLGLRIAVTPISAEPAVRFDKDCIAAVRAAAEVSGLSTRDIGLARRPQLELHLARCAHGHDLRAVQGRHQP